MWCATLTTRLGTGKWQELRIIWYMRTNVARDAARLRGVVHGVSRLLVLTYNIFERFVRIAVNDH